jgi:hypothetical protein
VSTASYPYSRLPSVDEEQIDSKEDNSKTNGDNVLHNLILFFNHAGVADIAVESEEFKNLCLSILKFDNCNIDKQNQFLLFMNKNFKRDNISYTKK